MKFLFNLPKETYVAVTIGERVRHGIVQEIGRDGIVVCYLGAGNSALPSQPTFHPWTAVSSLTVISYPDDNTSPAWLGGANRD